MTAEEFDQLDNRLHQAASARGEINTLQWFLARSDWRLDQDAIVKTYVRDISQPGGSQETVMRLPLKDLLPMLRDYAEKRLAAVTAELEAM